jgi:hypothetical protein
VVYSTKCMGKEKALYVSNAMEQRIQRAGGLNGLLRCDEHAKPLEPREFTTFLAKAIETRKNRGRVKRRCRTERRRCR